MPVALAPVLVAAAVVVAIVGYAMLRRDPLEGIAAEDLAILSARGRRRVARPGLREVLGAPVGRLIRGLVGPRWEARLADQIERAGRPRGMTVEKYFTDQGFYVAVLWTVALVSLLNGQSFIALICLAVPVLAPEYILWASARERQDRIDQDLPDFLDVLAVVVSAGLGFHAALEQVSRQYGGPLADELQIVLREMSVGETLRAALGGMRDRTRSDSVDQFVTALLQAEELGAPLAATLNQIALDVRREAAGRVKRRAAQAAPKATVITIVILLPPTMALMIYGVLTAIGR